MRPGSAPAAALATVLARTQVLGERSADPDAPRAAMLQVLQRDELGLVDLVHHARLRKGEPARRRRPVRRAVWHARHRPRTRERSGCLHQGAAGRGGVERRTGLRRDHDALGFYRGLREVSRLARGGERRRVPRAPVDARRDDARHRRAGAARRRTRRAAARRASARRRRTRRRPVAGPRAARSCANVGRLGQIRCGRRAAGRASLRDRGCARRTLQARERHLRRPRRSAAAADRGTDVPLPDGSRRREPRRTASDVVRRALRGHRGAAKRRRTAGPHLCRAQRVVRERFRPACRTRRRSSRSRRTA